jgi:glycine hydroxymethyltransferase
MDEIAGLIHTVLSATEPTGSKTKYLPDEKLAAKVARQAASLLAPFPLYPSVDLGA